MFTYEGVSLEKNRGRQVEAEEETLAVLVFPSGH